MNTQGMPMPPHGLMGPIADDQSDLWLYGLLLWVAGLLIVWILIYLKKQKYFSNTDSDGLSIDPSMMLKGIETSLKELFDQRSELTQDRFLIALSQNVKSSLQVGRTEPIIGMTNQELMDWIDLKAAMPASLKSALKTFYNHTEKAIYRGEKLDESQIDALISLSQDVTNLCRKHIDESMKL